MAKHHVQIGWEQLYLFKIDALVDPNGEFFAGWLSQDAASPEPEFRGTAQGRGFQTFWDDGDESIWQTVTTAEVLAKRGHALHVRLAEFDRLAEEWQEEDHPRAPAGGPDGGQFVASGGGGGGAVSDPVAFVRRRFLTEDSSSESVPWGQPTGLDDREHDKYWRRDFPCSPPAGYETIKYRPDQQRHNEAMTQAEDCAKNLITFRLGDFGKDPDGSYEDQAAADPEWEEETVQTVMDDAAENLQQYIENNAVVIRLSPDALESVIADGRFKSQFETGSSGGWFDPSFRSQYEEFAFGIPQDIPAAERPIYGFIEDDESSTRAYWYGDAKVYLRDEVKERSTITAADSLDTGQPGYHAFNVRAGALFSDRIFEDAYDNRLEQRDDMSYVEVQVQGGVTLGDIDHVEMTKVGGSRDYWKEILEDNGIPVIFSEDYE